MNNHHNQILGKKIRQLRKLKGLSQKKLAERAHITDSYISKIERGKLPPNISPSEKVLKNLSETLGDSDSCQKLFRELMIVAGKIPNKDEIITYLRTKNINSEKFPLEPIAKLAEKERVFKNA